MCVMLSRQDAEKLRTFTELNERHRMLIWDASERIRRSKQDLEAHA